MHPVEVVVDIPSTIAVIAALIASLIALYFAWKFSKTVGGDMGAAFKFVEVGTRRAGQSGNRREPRGSERRRQR